MTNDMMTLQSLLAKQPDADIVREMLGFAAQRLMELEVEGKTGFAHLFEHLMFNGSEMKSFHSPKPIPKKSATGTSTDGSDSPSHHARTMRFRSTSTLRRAAMVIHQRRTTPGPAPGTGPESRSQPRTGSEARTGAEAPRRAAGPAPTRALLDAHLRQ